MQILVQYGPAAKAAIPELKQIADSLANDENNHLRNKFPDQAQKIRAAILEGLPKLEAL
jgi:hypothetical protein